MNLSAAERRMLAYIHTSIGLPGRHRIGCNIAMHCFGNNVAAMASVAKSLDRKGFIKVYSTWPKHWSLIMMSITLEGAKALGEKDANKP